MSVDLLPLSLLTIGLFMNTTVFNQGNHCIVALSLLPLKLEDGGNTAIITSSEQCQSLRDNILQPVQGRVVSNDYYATRATFTTFGGRG